MKGSRFGALLGSTLVLTLAVAGPAAAGPLPLYYSFGFDTDMAPPYSIHLGAGNWHVGSAGGPLATDQEIYDVLANLASVTIGGTGHGQTIDIGDGLIGESGFGFRLSNFDLGGAITDDLTDPATAFVWSYVGAGVITWSCCGGSPGGSLGAFNFGDPVRFVGFVTPSAYRGDRGAAFGGNLSFRFGASDCGDLAVGCVYDFSSGQVVMTAVPEPATSALVALGLASLYRRRRRIGPAAGR